MEGEAASSSLVPREAREMEEEPVRRRRSARRTATSSLGRERTGGASWPKGWHNTQHQQEGMGHLLLT